MSLTNSPAGVAPAVLTDEEIQNTVFPSCRIPLQSRKYFYRKYYMERMIAAILIVIFLPLLLVFSVLIKLTSRGSAIYSQIRTGEAGKPFTIHKLRSMANDAESRSGKIWSVNGDSRVTRLGRFLRFTHLDEIPQLFNVLRGEMTLVGPRPERPEFVEVLIGKVDNYYRRHSIKPGITGLAQIYLPPDETLESVKMKIKYDLIYLRHACLTLDLRIWICTALRLVGVRHGYGPRLIGLDAQLASFRRPAGEANVKSRSRPALVPFVFNAKKWDARSNKIRRVFGRRSSPELATAASDSSGTHSFDSSNSYSFGSSDQLANPSDSRRLSH